MGKFHRKVSKIRKFLNNIRFSWEISAETFFIYFISSYFLSDKTRKILILFFWWIHLRSVYFCCDSFDNCLFMLIHSAWQLDDASLNLLIDGGETTRQLFRVPYANSCCSTPPAIPPPLLPSVPLHIPSSLLPASQVRLALRQ